MDKRLQNLCSLLMRCAAAFLVMLVLMLGLLYAACALPAAPVRQNVADSLPLLRQEGMYPEFFGFKLFQMDNYTDTLMLFEAATVSDGDTLTAMMTNRAYGVEEFETFDRALADYLQNGAECAYPPFDYNRYWHGYLVLLRPLLLCFTLGQIRIINYICFFALLALVMYKLKKYTGTVNSALFALSQLLVACFLIPHQLQFSWCFYIAYAGSLAMLGKQPLSLQKMLVALLCVGGLTAYFDLLVTPIITLGLPMAVWLLRAQADARQRLGAVVAGSVFWGAGYGSIWASKWVIAGLVTGQNVLADAANQAQIRTVGDSWKGMALTWPNILAFVTDSLTERHLLWPLVFALAAFVAAVALCVRSRALLAQNACYLLTAAMPLAWYVLLKAHSIQHGWFTWRALMVLFFAGLLFLRQTCSVQVGLARLNFRGGNKNGKNRNSDSVL